VLVYGQHVGLTPLASQPGLRVSEAPLPAFQGPGPSGCKMTWGECNTPNVLSRSAISPSSALLHPYAIKKRAGADGRCIGVRGGAGLADDVALDR
jgi:hypothetical protein